MFSQRLDEQQRYACFCLSVVSCAVHMTATIASGRRSLRWRKSESAERPFTMAQGARSLALPATDRRRRAASMHYHRWPIS